MFVLTLRMRDSHRYMLPFLSIYCVCYFALLNSFFLLTIHIRSLSSAKKLMFLVCSVRPYRQEKVIHGPDLKEVCLGPKTISLNLGDAPDYNPDPDRIQDPDYYPYRTDLHETFTRDVFRTKKQSIDSWRFAVFLTDCLVTLWFTWDNHLFTSKEFQFNETCEYPDRLCMVAVML